MAIAPNVRAALVDIAKQHVANGWLSVEDARRDHPEVTDWPQPPAKAQMDRRGNYVWAYSYLNGMVGYFLDGIISRDELAKYAAEVEAALNG